MAGAALQTRMVSGFSSGSALFLANQPPTVVSMTPSSGTGRTQTFRFIISDPDGAADLAGTEISFVGNSIGCQIRVQGTALWLMNDSGGAWLGPVTIGTTLQNASCGVNGTNASIKAADNNLIVNLDMTFAPVSASLQVTVFAWNAAASSPATTVGQWTVPGTNHAPTIVSLTPYYGWGARQTFSIVASDPDGAADLASIQISFFASSTVYCYATVGANSIQLWDDAGLTWLGPVTPGSAVSVENSYCRIDAADSSVQDAGTSRTVNLDVTFVKPIPDLLTVSLAVEDMEGAASPWIPTGAWSVVKINMPPSVVSVSPNSGTGTTQTFTFIASDPDGAADLAWIYIAFGTGCYVKVGSTGVLLQNEVGSWLGPTTLGGGATLENSHCRVNGPNSSMQNVGNNRTVVLDVTFKVSQAQMFQISMEAEDLADAVSFWNTVGTWTVKPANRPPIAVSVSPYSGSGIGGVFLFDTVDPDGVGDLAQTHISFASATAYCYAIVAGTNVLLLNDTGSAWLGPVVLGSAATLENSYCRVNGTNSRTMVISDNLAVYLDVKFKALYGPLNVFLAAEDLEGAASPWLRVGTWTVGDQPPIVVSMAPSTGSGINQNFTFVTSDPDGASDLVRTHISFSSASSYCYAIVSGTVSGTVVQLLNDSGSAWLGPVTLGGTSTVENSNCRVNGSGSSLQNVGNNRTVRLDVTFKALTGLLNAFLAAEDQEGAVTAWMNVGTWTAGSGNQLPAVVSMSPNTGSGTSQTFSFVTSDPNGATDLAWTHISFASAANPSAYCYALVSTAGVLLLNDSGTAWLGPVTLGTATTVENGNCRLNGTNSSLQNVGNNRTLNLDVTFKGLTGSLNVFVAAVDLAGAASSWITVGHWTAI
jgi:hypothetical protein